MSKSAEGGVTQHHKTSPLCWVARLLSLGYGLFIALYVLGTGFPTLTDYASRGETGELLSALLRWLVLYLPLVPAAIIAWRWHLVGGTLVIAAGAVFCMHCVLSSAGWPAYLFILPIFAGGLLHLVVWYKDKRAEKMRNSAEGRNGSVMQRQKASRLCWAARLLSLGYGLVVALYALGAGHPIVIEYASRGEIEESMFALLNWLPFFIPLVLAVIAWRWHLVGGTLVTAVSGAFYLYFILSSGTQWIVYLYMLPILAGGLLHLVAWYKEKKTDQVTQPT